jgi:predicted DsbA family dithiol-disulfide isomerase
MNDLVCSFCIHFLQSLNSKLNQSDSKKQVQISKWVNAMDEELMTLNKNRI